MFRWVAAIVAGAAAVVLTAPGAQAEPSTFLHHRIPMLDWTENLAFDGLGGLWITHVAQNRIVRYDTAGTATAELRSNTPGGIVRGPDSLMYVAQPWLPWDPDAKILRFDPRLPNPSLEVFATGLGTVLSNGLAVDRAGNLYVTDQFQTGVTKVRPDRTVDREWSRAANIRGTNGIVVHGDSLYTSVTIDLANTLWRIPLDRPDQYTVYAHLTIPGTGRVLDDLDIAADGTIYLTTLTSPTTGDLLRVDPRTRQPDIIASGPAMTSTRLATGFGPADGDLFVTSLNGDVLRVPVR